MECRIFGYIGTSWYLQLCSYCLRLVLVAAKGTGQPPRNFSFSNPCSGRVVGVFVPWGTATDQLNSRWASDYLCYFLSGMREEPKQRYLKQLILAQRCQNFLDTMF